MKTVVFGFTVMMIVALGHAQIVVPPVVRRELVTQQNVDMAPGSVVELPRALCRSRSAITGCGCTGGPPNVVVQTNEITADGFGACVCAFKNVGTTAVNVDLQSQAHCLVGARLVVA